MKIKVHYFALQAFVKAKKSSVSPVFLNIIQLRVAVTVCFCQNWILVIENLTTLAVLMESACGHQASHCSGTVSALLPLQ